ncbi:hypothetical protein FSP39_002588 [Pinctada imbricata]|uniref:Sugar phosphate phosphatase n=1 Tax=Pinctada imbricata TaxID=66713 RepID=A0AA88Y4J3_PINIB|nr:hypothetical protein FSP39_002588 [Pinctada imbricata]
MFDFDLYIYPVPRQPANDVMPGKAYEGEGVDRVNGRGRERGGGRKGAGGGRKGEVSSFAFKTIKDRLPVILSKIADTVYRSKVKVKEENGEDGLEDLKAIVGSISKLRNEVQTNKPVIPLVDDRSDTPVWNRYLTEVTERDQAPPKWFVSPWLYVECYMYRRIQEAVEKCKLLQKYDVFEDQKKKALMDSQDAVEVLFTYLKTIIHKVPSASEDDITEYVTEFIQISLWGNKCDLSISASQENAQTESILDQLHHLAPNILIDNTQQVLKRLREGLDVNQDISIVLDNAGFELITDLCLAELLLACGFTTVIRFHGKAMPWFVSDVTMRDFMWTLETLSESGHEEMKYFGNLWKNRLTDGSWIINCHDFWTLPFDYSLMKNYAPDLHKLLSSSLITFFKGDLNYRKLVGDLSWNTTVKFETSLRGFHPNPVCALRTCKADVVVGLQEGQADEVKVKDDSWMVNGNWAIISYCGKVQPN